MKRILLTGATGFIGRHCLPALAQDARRGTEVHAVSSQNRAEERSDVIWHTVDLLDGEAGARCIESIRPTHWLHLAWCVAPGQWASDPANFDWVRATLSMLRAFQAAGGKRVVMAGSAAEYDWRYGFCTDVTPKNPASVYGTCKLALAQMLDAHARQTGLSSAWGRAFFTYGPHEHPNRLVASVIRHLLRGEPALCSAGEQRRDYLHVQDLADAYVMLLHSEATGAFNIGSGEAVAVKEIVMGIAQRIGRPELVRLGALPGGETELPLVVADDRRLRHELQWRPRFTRDEGLAQTIAWWQERQAKSRMERVDGTLR